MTDLKLMNMLDSIVMNILPIIAGAIAVLVLFGFVLLGVRIKRQAARLAEAESRIESLATNLRALCAGAVGVDRRVAQLERHGRNLEHRQEGIESQRQGGKHYYGDAIQMVRQGASAENLIQEFELSRNEADLIVMVHGMKEAG